MAWQARRHEAHLGSRGVHSRATGTWFQMLPTSSISERSSTSLPGAISRPRSPAPHEAVLTPLLSLSGIVQTPGPQGPGQKLTAGRLVCWVHARCLLQLWSAWCRAMQDLQCIGSVKPHILPECRARVLPFCMHSVSALQMPEGLPYPRAGTE